MPGLREPLPQSFQPFRGGAVLQPTQPEEEGDFRSSPLLRIQTLGPALAPTYPGLATYPLELLGLLMSPLERREINLVPTLSISEEYNDNIFLNNDSKRYDFITSFTQGLMRRANRPRFQLAAGSRTCPISMVAAAAPTTAWLSRI